MRNSPYARRESLLCASSKVLPFSEYPTNNALFMNFRLSSDAEMLLIFSKSVLTEHTNRRQLCKNVYAMCTTFRRSFHYVYHRWWLGTEKNTCFSVIFFLLMPLRPLTKLHFCKATRFPFSRTKELRKYSGDGGDSIFPFYFFFYFFFGGRAQTKMFTRDPPSFFSDLTSRKKEIAKMPLSPHRWQHWLSGKEASHLQACFHCLETKCFFVWVFACEQLIDESKLIVTMLSAKKTSC